MMPEWLWPFLFCVSAVFSSLGLQRIFLGIADRGDVLLVVLYGFLLGYSWRVIHARSSD